jgi:hypothetical protein
VAEVCSARSAWQDRRDAKTRSRGHRGTTESQSTGHGTARPGSESITAAKRWSDGQVDDRQQQRGFAAAAQSTAGTRKAASDFP